MNDFSWVKFSSIMFFFFSSNGERLDEISSSAMITYDAPILPLKIFVFVSCLVSDYSTFVLPHVLLVRGLRETLECRWSWISFSFFCQNLEWIFINCFTNNRPLSDGKYLKIILRLILFWCYQGYSLIRIQSQLLDIAVHL